MNELTQYVIYWNPSDYPGRFVTREWKVTAGQVLAAAHPCAVADSLAEARAIVPDGLVHIGRMPGDDPAIFEVWT